MPRRTPQGHGLGWRLDQPDQRDFAYAAPVATMRDLPPVVDLRPQMPPVYDQGDLGSCIANAIGAAIEFEQRKQGLLGVTPSRLWIYYRARVLEDTVDYDAGAMLRDGMKIVAKLGAPPETQWPYVIARFRDQPPATLGAIAAKSRVTLYRRIPRALQTMKACLADGYPFVGGVSVYESFESPEVARTGVVPLPRPREQVLGGHAVLVVGYDDARQIMIVRNSWGSGWGDAGYCYLPMTFLTQRTLSADFWTVRMIATPEEQTV